MYDILIIGLGFGGMIVVFYVVCLNFKVGLIE